MQRSTLITERSIVSILQERRVRVGIPRLFNKLFENRATFSTSSTMKAKSRKKSRLKMYFDLNKTTRDRMRVLLEKNQLPSDAFSQAKANQLLELAQSRLSFFRNKIYQNWNPDYLSLQHKRPNRLDVVMDARWWAWNIAFALLPAVLIATFCELRGKPLVEKYRKQQRERQEKQLILSEHPNNEEHGAKDGLSWSPLTVVRNLVLGKASPEGETETSSEKETTRADTKPPLITTTTQHNSDEVSTETLLRRIQQLERRLGIDTSIEDGADSKQSGIRNRAMADIRSKWEEEKRESESPQTAGSLLDTFHVSEWVQMIKSTVSSLSREQVSSAIESRNDGKDFQKQTATRVNRDIDTENVHEDEVPVPSPTAQTEDSGNTTKARMSWWKFW